jgi:hypothetical protein
MRWMTDGASGLIEVKRGLTGHHLDAGAPFVSHVVNETFESCDVVCSGEFEEALDVGRRAGALEGVRVDPT